MSLTLTPQDYDYGDVNTIPDIRVEVEESDNLAIQGVAQIIDSENQTVKVETFNDVGRHTYIPDLLSVWDDMEDGETRIQLTVTSYDENAEEEIRGDSRNLYLEKESYPYTGSYQNPTLIGYDPDKMIIEGDYRAKNQGSYRFKVKPKDGYRWTTQSTANPHGWLEFRWIIEKGAGFVRFSARMDKTTYYDGETAYYTVLSGINSIRIPLFNASTSRISIMNNSNPQAVSAYIDDSGTMFDYELVLRIYSSGSSSIKITGFGDDNYNSATVTLVVSFNYTVTIDTLPSQHGTLYENGNLLSPSWWDYNSTQLTIRGELSGYTAGIYTVYFKPKDGFKWWDGTTGEKAVTWKISERESSGSYNPTPSYSNPITLSTNRVTTSWANSQDAYVTLTNNSSSNISVELRSKTAYGPYATFNLSDTHPYIYETGTINAYGSAQIKIMAGAPPTLIEEINRAIELKYKDISTGESVGATNIIVDIIS